MLTSSSLAMRKTRGAVQLKVHASHAHQMGDPANGGGSAVGVPAQSHPKPQSEPWPGSEESDSIAQSSAGSDALYTDPKTIN